MRFLPILLAGFFLTGGVFFVPTHSIPDPTDPQKFAIVFAIGEYPESGGWSKISSANDVPLILGALQEQGFNSENIFVIRDSMATRAGIHQAFDKYILSSDRVRPGDVVFVHFSSHGQQIVDNNADEVDGFDEALVPYDAGIRYNEGVYEGENHLRDDELGEIFGRVRQKLGPEGNLMALIDACHSGTGTRGMVRARGTQQKMAPKGYDPEVQTTTRGAARGQSFLESSPQSENKLAPMVVISGASANELNYETHDDNGNGVGSLSYTFSKVMVNAKQGMSYRELFDRIKIEMQQRVPQQTPQIEGMVDQELFGGAVIESQPYFVPQVWEDEQTISLNAGTLQGLYDSTRVGVFDLSENDVQNAKPLGTGYIVDASLMDSYVVLDKPFNGARNRELKIVIISQNYADLKLSVKLDLELDSEVTEQLRQHITASGVATVGKESPDLLITNKDVSRGNTLEIYTSFDKRLTSVPLQATSKQGIEHTASEIIKTIKKQARTNFLRTLEMEDSRRDVSVQIVPLKGKIVRGRFELEREMEMEEFRNEAGNIVFEQEQVFKLRVINRGYSDAYFTILDFTPDGQLSLIAPNANSRKQPGDYLIQAGSTLDLDELFIMQAPFGNEMFKVIATEQPLDLRPIIDPIQGIRAGSRGPDNPFQQLMEDAASATRAGTLSMGSSSANISSLSFQVVAKSGDQQ